MSTLQPTSLALSCKALTKYYGKQQVLNKVNLQLQQAEVLCVLGANGAGKTTLINTFLGLTAPDSGQLAVFEQPQTGQQRSLSIRQRWGVMMQIGALNANLTVAEQCDLFSSYYPDGHNVTQLLNIAGLQQQANQRFGKLSGGQKQRLLFALALAGKPQLVFLDEPTLGMDIEARHALWQQITQLKQQGVAVLLTTHYLEEAEKLADRIVILANGSIIANDTPAQLKALTQYKVIRCSSALHYQQLLALPGVIDVKQQQTTYELQSQAAELTLGALLQQDPTLTGLEVNAVALEQAFLHIIQRQQTGDAA